MTDIMDGKKAWRILGRNPEEIYKNVKSKPLNRKIDQVKSDLEVARIISKNLLIKHHPDKGGDIEKFKLVQQAIFAIEKHTEDFIRKVNEKLQDSRNQNKNILIFTKDEDK